MEKMILFHFIEQLTIGGCYIYADFLENEVNFFQEKIISLEILKLYFAQRKKPFKTEEVLRCCYLLKELFFRSSRKKHTLKTRIQIATI